MLIRDFAHLQKEIWSVAYRIEIIFVAKLQNANAHLKSKIKYKKDIITVFFILKVEFREKMQWFVPIKEGYQDVAVKS